MSHWVGQGRTISKEIPRGHGQLRKLPVLREKKRCLPGKRTEVCQRWLDIHQIMILLRGPPDLRTSSSVLTMR
jgi:hypothetical protein